MKILIVAGTFPPYAPSSASRANKFARFLLDSGHDVKVLAPRLPGQDMSLKPEISDDKIIFTEYYDINTFPNYVKGCLKKIFLPKTSNRTETEHNGQNDKSSKGRGKESTLSRLFRSTTNIPDRWIGWYPQAIRTGKKILEQWSPDIIYSTAPPYTGFIVAKKLAKMVDIPWIADYRDLWIDESNEQYMTFRGKINKTVEKWILSSCSGLITVTRNWSEKLRKAHNIPVVMAMNGFDPSDFNPASKKILFPDHLTILYAGGLYSDRRDPSPLFEALSMLGTKKEKIKILLYTPNALHSLQEKNKQQIEKYQLHDQIVANKFIPQSELLKIEQGADNLLLLRWNDPREDGVIAGKLFEYIGAGRPILSVGSTTGEAADIIRDNNFGTVLNDPREIADYLEKCLIQKFELDSSEPANHNRAKFSRSIQFEKIEKFMREIVNQQII